MITQGQKNIKVHFAGAEQTDFAYCICKGAGIKYILFSAFGFLYKCLGIKQGGCLKRKPIFNELENLNVAHSIMDSGLFTLMFGAQAGKRTEKDIEIWYANLTQFVLKNKIQSTCVEIDCQKILGVEKAWELRKRMRIELPDNRIINVFHIEDGMKGLDRLIEFSDYIAVSVPELRILGKKSHTVKLAHYIKNKKPEIDIHLLGCTEMKLLKELKFCTSSDSTTWQQINRYGEINRKSIKNINQSKVNHSYSSAVLNMMNSYNIEHTESKINYYSRYILAANYYKNLFQKELGEQE